MNIGKQIKKYREIMNISQEELADKIFVTRQTISNWENDKNYPDIKSISLLCNVFDVSLDEFIKGDIEEMKKKIDIKEMENYNLLSIIYTIEFIVMLISAYPLLKFFKIVGLVIWLFIAIITLITSFKIEKIYKKHDIRTYKEIVAFTEGRALTKKETIEEKAKRPYQKYYLECLVQLLLLLCLLFLRYYLIKLYWR